MEKLSTWTLYLEDFAVGSPEYVYLFKNGTLTEITIYYESNT